MIEVASGVEVIQSRFWRTNTVLVLRRFAVDPGVYDDELAALADLAPAVGAGVATHAHWDHLIWPERWADAPRYASPETIALAGQALGAAESNSHPSTTGLVPLFDGAAIAWAGGPEIVPVVTGAHIAGHTSLHLPELGVLLAGDLVSDVDVPFPDLDAPDPFATYRAGLDRLAGLTSVNVVVSGHGSPCDGRMFRQRIDADRRFLDELDLNDPRLQDDAVRKANEATLRWVNSPR